MSSRGRARVRGWGAGLAVTLALNCGLASAQEDKAKKSGKGAPKVIQLEEIRIEGRVQKPNAFYILNRSNMSYELDSLKTSFLPQVVRSVNTEPF